MTDTQVSEVIEQPVPKRRGRPPKSASAPKRRGRPRKVVKPVLFTQIGDALKAESKATNALENRIKELEGKMDMTERQNNYLRSVVYYLESKLEDRANSV